MSFLAEVLEDITGKNKRPEVKGTRFEKFVEEEVFTDVLFDLVEKTQSFESNSKRFEERSLNPDFLFRDKRTGEEFWIEAKYRKSLFRNKKGQEVCEICTPQQLNRYKAVEKNTNKKVYILLGLGEDPRSPDTVHLIYVMDAYPQIFRSLLKKTFIYARDDE